MKGIRERRGQSAVWESAQLTVRQAGRQAAVLANQQFIFPVNTYRDLTIHFRPWLGVSTVVQTSRFCSSSLIQKEVPHLKRRENMPSSVLAKCYGTLLFCIMRVELGKVQCRFKVTVTQAQHCWPDTTQSPQKRTCPKTWPAPVRKEEVAKSGDQAAKDRTQQGLSQGEVGQQRKL